MNVSKPIFEEGKSVKVRGDDMMQGLKIVLNSFVLLGLISNTYQPTSHSRMAHPAYNAMTQANHVSVVQCDVQKLNDDEKAEVEKTVKLLIDKMFKERKVEQAFEQHFLFSSLSPQEKEMIDSIGFRYLKEHKAFDAKVVARIFAMEWEYEYMDVFLALGTKNLSDFEGAFEQAGSEIESERKRILSQQGISETDFYTLLNWESAKNSKALENKLSTFEHIYAELLQFIEKKTDNSIYEKNLTYMQKNVVIKKKIVENQVFYLVGIEPMFVIVFVRRGDVWKMISFSDVL